MTNQVNVSFGAIVGLVSVLIATTAYAAEQTSEADPQAFKLWAGGPVPKSSEAAILRNVEFHVVKRRVPEIDGYNWLHGVAVVRHQGALYASFGHNRGSENTGTEVANGRKSTDDGRTWGPVFTIDAGNGNLAVSHGVFLSYEGRLWAFHGSFHGHMEKVHTRAYVLNDETALWQPKGVVAENGFWPTQAPRKMDDGNWIMAGMSVTGPMGGADDPAAVAISQGNDLTRWTVVAVPKPPEMDLWGESALIVDQADVLLVARYRLPVALAATSHDYGRTWTTIRQSNLPMAASKPYAGVLSTGQRYLIGTTTADSGNRRSPLTIAVGHPGKKVFSKIYRIRDAVYDGPGESNPGCRLSYPYAEEYDGKLYVVYSNDGSRGANRNSAELAVIPLKSLGAD